MNNGQGIRICGPTEDSPLDLTFIDIQFAHLATWVVHDDEWGSDHYLIFTHLGISPLHEETCVQRWNLIGSISSFMCDIWPSIVLGM